MKTNCNFKSFSFEFQGRPQPKARPRARRRGPFLSVYSPKSDFEKALTQYASMLPGRPKKIKCAVSIIMDFYFKRHKGIPKSRVFKETRADLDNLIKVSDFLNDCGYLHDDSQVVHIEAQKLWSDKKEGLYFKMLCVECDGAWNQNSQIGQ